MARLLAPGPKLVYYEPLTYDSPTVFECLPPWADAQFSAIMVSPDFDHPRFLANRVPWSYASRSWFAATEVAFDCRSTNKQRLIYCQRMTSPISI